MQDGHAHVVLRRKHRRVRRGSRQRRRSGVISACSVNHTRSVIAPSRAHTQPHFTRPPTTTTPQQKPSRPRHCPACRRRPSPATRRAAAVAAPSYIVARALTRSRLPRFGAVDEAPCCRRAVRHHLHFYLRLRDLHGLDGFSPHPPAQRLPHHQQKHGQSRTLRNVVASLNQHLRLFKKTSDCQR